MYHPDDDASLRLLVELGCRGANVTATILAIRVDFDSAVDSSRHLSGGEPFHPRLSFSGSVGGDLLSHIGVVW